jgi:hypothetical protein
MDVAADPPGRHGAGGVAGGDGGNLARRAAGDRARDPAGQPPAPWFADLLGGRPHQGPHALLYLEKVLAALEAAPGGGHVDDVLQGARTVLAYVVGAFRGEANELLAERASGMAKAEWQAATGPYMERMVATGRFPMLAKVMREARHPPAEAAFEAGLDLVLDGLAARSRPPGRRGLPRHSGPP